jgi:hypothetical protein
MWFGLDNKILDTTIFSEIFLFQELRLPAAKSWLQRFYFIKQSSHRQDGSISRTVLMGQC